MSANFEIVEAKPHHVGAILHNMRRGHLASMLAVGFDKRSMHKTVRIYFDDSSFRRAWMIDGKLAGLGGVRGTTISPKGFIWLILSEEATLYPIEIVKEARRQMNAIMLTKRKLETIVVESDQIAMRFARFMGFKDLQPSNGIANMVYVKGDG